MNSALRLSALAVLAALAFAACAVTGTGGKYPEACSDFGFAADRCAGIVQHAQELLPVCTVGVPCGRSSVTPKRVISVELKRPGLLDGQSGVIVSVRFHLDAGSPDFYPGVPAGQVDFAVDLTGCRLVGRSEVPNGSAPDWRGPERLWC